MRSLSNEQSDSILLYVLSEENLADILTKGLGGQAHKNLARLAGINIDIHGSMEKEEYK